VRAAALLLPTLLGLGVLGAAVGCGGDEAGEEVARIRQLAAAEARRRGLDEVPEVEGALEDIRLQSESHERREREEARLRDALFEEIRGGLVLSEEEVRAHYEANRVRYTERRVRLRRQGFASEAEARAAEVALGAGGRLDPEQAEEIGPLASAALASEIGPEALGLAAPGDRVRVSRDGRPALVELVEILPAEPQPLEAVRGRVERSLRALRAQRAFYEAIDR